MPKILPEHLPEFTDFVDRFGGNIGSAEVVERYDPLDFAYRTVVDEGLDPFSDEYLHNQIALYREIAGRPLDQESGELHSVDVDALVGTANPLGSRDVAHISDNVRVLSTLIALSDLGHAAPVLDMGAGHGISSEIFAFSGCRVYAVDIDPALGELSRRRAEVRGFELERSQLNFDDLSAVADDSYSAAYFFQSFHHCLRPWDLIATLRRKLIGNGVIGFAGEPMQSNWWKNWGIRLDAESLYVARRFGWFESGWSHAFIRACFERNGMSLTFLNGGLGGTEYGFATADPQKRAAILRRAEILGLREVHEADGADLPSNRYHSEVGEQTLLDGHMAFRQRPDAGGALFFGPYTQLDAGAYEMSFIASSPDVTDGRFMLDVMSGRGTIKWLREEITLQAQERHAVITRLLSLSRPVADIEFRVFVRPDQRWTMTLPTLRRIS